MATKSYIHGTHPSEQARLALLNTLTNKDFIKFLDLAPGMAVLEVGSGLGILANEVASRLNGGRMVGLEYSFDQLASARGENGRLRFVRGDGANLPFHDNEFDLVYCRYVIEHLHDVPAVLKEIRRVLKPGGRMYAQEVNILINQFYPDCPMFDHVWQQFAKLQSELGGDALVGKKLYTLFKAAAFRDISLSIQPEIHHPELPTFKPWIENLIGNVLSGEQELVRRDLASDRGSGESSQRIAVAHE